MDTLSSTLFSETEWNELTEKLRLSMRQMQIVQAIFKGYGDKQIARDLQITVPTVRTHLARLSSKIKVQDRQELILTVFRHYRSACRHLNCPRR